jgi:hypothetical protein
MRYNRSNIVLQKSVEAAKAAIELYNKPVFPYRNEGFSILMINAWELLLKAKRLKENNNKMTSIYIKERIKNKKGTPSKREKYKRNRTGNFLTSSILELIKTEVLDKNLSKNLALLIEIRDNAIHCFNRPKIVEKHYLEIIGATLSSYQTALTKWFSYDITKENMFIIPIGFNIPKKYDVTDVTTKEEKNILKYISEQRNRTDTNSDFDVALNIDVKFIKSKSESAHLVKYSPDGLPIKVDSEEVFKEKYPISYEDLRNKLRNRYTDFKQNHEFWNTKKRLEENKQFSGVRYLDYYAQKGIKKVYYSTEIIKEFDKFYTRKESHDGIARTTLR